MALVRPARRIGRERPPDPGDRRDAARAVATAAAMNPVVQAFFDPATFTISYVVREAAGTACAIIDPVLDYEPKAARISTRLAQEIIEYVHRHRLEVEWLLETHIHADHMSAAQELKRALGGRVAIGERIREVQTRFAPLFGMEATFKTDGSQFDRLLSDDETFAIGTLHGRALHTPGHTPACMTYLIGDAAFVGDTLFMPDYGTARTDFPGGNARALYRSIQRILQLPRHTRLFMCHDYMPGGRELRWETSIDEERQCNPMVKDGISEDEFVRLREARDAESETPTLMLPSLQVNIRAGHLPPVAGDGIRYLKLPLNQFGKERS